MNENILKDIYKRFGDTLIRLGRQNGKSQLAKDLNYLFTRAETAYFLEEQNKRYREALKGVIDIIGNEDWSKYEATALQDSIHDFITIKNSDLLEESK